MFGFGKKRTSKPRRKHTPSIYKPGAEQLEARLTPTIYLVTSLTNALDPSDGVVTLREAILASQNAASGPGYPTGNHLSMLPDGASGDIIRFNLPLPAGERAIQFPTPGEAPMEAASEFVISKPLWIDGFHKDTAGMVSGDARINLDAAGASRRHFRVTSTGALFLSGLTLSNGTVVGANGATPGASGANAMGGAVYSQGYLSLDSVALVNNAVRGGNGANISAGLAGSGGAARGGAVAIEGAATIFSIVNSTFVNNSATGGNGGNGPITGEGGIPAGGALYLSSDTFSTVLGNTFLGNKADGGRRGITGTVATPQGTSLRSVAKYKLSNNLIANGASGAPVASIGGSATSGSNNLFAHGSYPAALGLTNDKLLLGPFGNYGGLVNTVPLLPGSPAIDTGTGAGADARGNATANAIRDVGSFESQGFTLTHLSGNGTRSKINTAFTAPLSASISPKNPLEPVQNGTASFTFDGGLVALSNSTLTIPANGTISSNATAKSAPIPYNVTLSLAGGSNLTFRLTNQAPTSLAFAQQPTKTKSGAVIKASGGGNVIVEVLDQDGVRIANENSRLVNMTLLGGSFSNGTLVKPVLNGVAQFDNLVINQAGVNYKLNAKSIALTQANSTPFEVTASQILLTPVVDHRSGENFTIRVTAKDEAGNVVTTFNEMVKLTIGNPVGARFSGGNNNITFAVMNGNTTSPNIKIDLAADGYVLNASSPNGNFTPILSNAFNITASHLVFAVAPSKVRSGDPFAIRVEARDRTNNPAANFNGTINLALMAGAPADAGLAGNLSLNATMGVANFGNLSLIRSFKDYVFRTSAPIDPILNNQTPKVEVTARYLSLNTTLANPNFVRANTTFNVTAQAFDADSKASITFKDPIRLATDPPLGVGMIIPANPVTPANPGDAVTFANVRIRKGGAVTLKVTHDNAVGDPRLLENGTPLTVLANSLAFRLDANNNATFVPDKVVSGKNFSIQVEGRDDLGNLADIGANLTISISETSRTVANQNFNGSLTQNAQASSTATFNPLTIDKWGNYRFRITPVAGSQIVDGLAAIDTPMRPALNNLSLQITADHFEFFVEPDDPVLALWRAAAGQTVVIKQGMSFTVPDFPVATVYDQFLTRAWALDVTREIDRNYKEPVVLSASGGPPGSAMQARGSTQQVPNNSLAVTAIFNNGVVEFQADLTHLGTYQLIVTGGGLTSASQSVIRSSQSRRF